LWQPEGKPIKTDEEKLLAILIAEELVDSMLSEEFTKPLRFDLKGKQKDHHPTFPWNRN
jgi:hypothetical protein